MRMIVLMSLVSLSFAQLSPSAYKIDSLPFTDTLPANSMYSGFLPINKNSLQPEGNLFFWFIESTNLSQNIPLLIWLSGGPGRSSLSAQFQQHGIMRVEQNPINPNQAPNITFTPQSWTQIGHLLYVDNPIGTGFSYNLSVPLRTNHTQIATDFYNFLQHFFKVFSDFKTNPLYLTGESYAGKYVPFIAQEILIQNQANAQEYINLSGLILSNPLLVPIIQRTQMHNLAQNIGLVSTTQLFQLYTLENQCFTSFSQDRAQSRYICNKVRDYINRVDGDVDLLDVRKLISELVQPWELYMRGDYNSSVLEAFHVQNSPKIPIYQQHSDQVSKALDPVFITSSIEILKHLIRKIPVLMFIGQFDGLDGVEGQREIIELLELEDEVEFKHRSQNFYQYQNELNQWKIGGYYRQVQNFSWAVISGAGHSVAKTKLNLTVALISDYLKNNHTIPCNESPSFNCTYAHDIQCEAMNQCNGENGFCQQGVCRCFNGYFGADCSMKIILVDTSINQNFTISGYSSIVLQTVPLKDTTISMVLRSDHAFDLYAMRNTSLADPVPLSDYDVVYKNVKEYLDIPNQNVVESNSDFLHIKNPTSSVIQVSLSHKSLVSQIQRINQDSFFAPFNGGFVLALVFFIAAIVSIILNCYLRKRLKVRKVNTYQISEC